MKTTVKLIILALTFLALAASAAYAKTPQEELQQMVEQLQKTPGDNGLRERIIKLALDIQPSPGVPPEAERFEGRAQYAFKSAKSEAEMLDAAREYLKAVDVAPWFANNYFNLCVILEKANRPAEAVKACQLYLVAAPKAPDASEVRKRVAGLEYALERQRAAVNDRRRCGDYETYYEYSSARKVAWISGGNIAAQLISSLYRGVWRNQLMLTIMSEEMLTQRYELTPIDKTFQLDDRVSGTPYYRLTIAGDGRITFGGSGSAQAEIVTSITELLQLRNTKLSSCNIVTKGGKFFVLLPQGGPPQTKDGALVAGKMFFESDCSGNLVGEKPGWFPAEFVPFPDEPQGFTVVSADACLKSSKDGLGWLAP